MTAGLGARVKARREELHLSMQGLADATKGAVSKTTVAEIEGGKTPNPGLDKLRGLAGALGWTLDELDGKPAAPAPRSAEASAGRGIPLKDIEADPDNPRTVDVGNLVDAAFVDSIRVEGLLQAVTVRRSPDPAGRPWRIAFGGRRYAALVLIHGPESPVEVAAKETDVSGSRLLLQQLVENVQREDMNAMDLAAAVTRLVDAGQDTAAIATVLKKGRRWVQEMASVGHHLTKDGQDALRKGVISISQAVALAAERDEERQNNLMARASVQGLNEDAIRDAIADAKARKAEAAAAEEERQAPALPMASEAPPLPVGGWKTWTNERGYFKWRLMKFVGRELYVVETDVQWRREGCHVTGWSATGQWRMVTPGFALVSAVEGAWHEYEAFGSPADAPTFRLSLLPWLAKGVRNQGDAVAAEHLTMRIEKRIAEKFDPPAIAKPGRPPAPAKKPEPPLTRAAVLKVPPWAKPIKLAHFVVMESKKATLVKGWDKMAAVLWSLYEISEPSTLRALGDRGAWQDDTGGRPFDYGGIVYRITDMKAR
jgi:ParB/RepB/Spo0J family partition protein